SQVRTGPDLVRCRSGPTRATLLSMVRKVYVTRVRAGSMGKSNTRTSQHLHQADAEFVLGAPPHRPGQRAGEPHGVAPPINRVSPQECVLGTHPLQERLDHGLGVGSVLAERHLPYPPAAALGAPLLRPVL